MSENEIETEVVDVTDEPETESEFPWKPVIAALVVGATSTAVVAKIRKIRKNKAEAEAAAPAAEPTPESTPVPNVTDLR